MMHYTCDFCGAQLTTKSTRLMGLSWGWETSSIILGENLRPLINKDLCNDCCNAIGEAIREVQRRGLNHG